MRAGPDVVSAAAASNARPFHAMSVFAAESVTTSAVPTSASSVVPFAHAARKRTPRPTIVRSLIIAMSPDVRSN